MPVTAPQVQLLLSGALVLFTAVLAGITYLYYRETQNHTKEMRKSREAKFKPVIKATIEEWHAIHHRFEFENTGNGAAHNVTARWGFNHSDYEREWEIPLMTPGQRHYFELPFESNGITASEQIESNLEGVEGILHFEGECTDALGNTVSFYEEIDVLGTIHSRAGELLDKDELREIRKSIEEISESVDGVADEIEMGGFAATLKRENQQAVVEMLEEHSELTVAELRDRTGIPQRNLAAIIKRLSQVRVIESTYDGYHGAPNALDAKIRLIESKPSS